MQNFSLHNMESIEQKRPVVTHMLFSGLGGHGSVFFSLVEADEEKNYDYRAIFCGVEEMTVDYKKNNEYLRVESIDHETSLNGKRNI